MQPACGSGTSTLGEMPQGVEARAYLAWCAAGRRDRHQRYAMFLDALRREEVAARQVEHDASALGAVDPSPGRVERLNASGPPAHDSWPRPPRQQSRTRPAAIPLVGLDRGRRAHRPRDVRGDRRHPHPCPRRRDAPPLAGGGLLAPLAGVLRAARAHREADRPPGGHHGARFAWRDRDRGQPRRQAARTPATPRPARTGCPAGAPRADARLALVPLWPRGRRVRVRDRRRPRLAGGRRPTARPRRARGVFARPYRRALSRRRGGRRHDGHCAGAVHGTCLRQTRCLLAEDERR